MTHEVVLQLRDPSRVKSSASTLLGIAGDLAAATSHLEGVAAALTLLPGAGSPLAAQVAVVSREARGCVGLLETFARLLGATPAELAAVDGALAQRAAGLRLPSEWLLPLGVPGRGVELAGTLALEAGLAMLPPAATGPVDLVGDRFEDGPGWARPMGPPVAAPTSPATPAAWLATISRAQATPGQIAVTRLANGRWVVSLPGIHSLRESPDPLDLPGALHAFASGHGAYARSVLLALAAAGVPVGAQLLLVGHSQGGIVAADLATDPEVSRRYRITHILAAASPIAGVPVPGQTHVLSLDNTDDVVPALDLHRHSRPATPRLTVNFRAERGSVGRNHDLAATYTPYAASEAFASTPGVAAWEADAGGYLTGGPATTQLFALRDRPPDTRP